MSIHFIRLIFCLVDAVALSYYNKKNKSVVFTTKRSTFMKKFFPILEKSPLFAGVDKSQIEVMLGCMDGKTVQYEKNAYIFRAGTCTETAGLLLDGSACIFQEDFWGNRNIIGKNCTGADFCRSLCLYAGSCSECQRCCRRACRRFVFADEKYDRGLRRRQRVLQLRDLQPAFNACTTKFIFK